MVSVDVCECELERQLFHPVVMPCRCLLCKSLWHYYCFGTKEMAPAPTSVHPSSHTTNPSKWISSTLKRIRWVASVRRIKRLHEELSTVTNGGAAGDAAALSPFCSETNLWLFIIYYSFWFFSSFESVFYGKTLQRIFLVDVSAILALALALLFALASMLYEWRCW